MILQRASQSEVIRKRFEREFVMRCLSKDHSERPRSALELSKLLVQSRTLEWGQEDVPRWCQAYQPASSSYRVARQERAAEPISFQLARSYIAK